MNPRDRSQWIWKATGSNRIPATLLVFLLASFCALSSRAIASYFLPGHNGYIASQSSTSARNYLRFGFNEIGLVRTDEYEGETRPAPQDMVVSHPPLVPLALSLLYRAFGFSEWIGRAFMLAIILWLPVILYLLAREGWAAGLSLVPAVLAINFPVLRFHGTIPMGEVPPLVLGPLLVFLYLRTLPNSPTPLYIAMVFVLMLGTLTDWFMYFVVPGIALHALFLSLRKHRFPLETVILFGASLISFLLFIAIISSNPGSYETLWNKLLQRIGVRPAVPYTLSDLVTTSVDRLKYLFTLPSMILALLGLANALFKVVRHRGGPVELAIMLLVLPPLLYCIIFSEIVFIHDFLLIYFVPAFALAAGEVLALAREREGVMRWLTIGAFSSLLVWSLVDSHNHIGRLHGWSESEFNIESLELARYLGKKVPREVALYAAFDYGLGRQFDFYSQHNVKRVWEIPARRPGEKPPYLLVDQRENEPQLVRILLNSFPVVVFDSRYLIFELSSKGTSATFVDGEEKESSSWLWKYFHGGGARKVRFVSRQDRLRELALRMAYGVSSSKLTVQEVASLQSERCGLQAIYYRSSCWLDSSPVRRIEGTIDFAWLEADGGSLGASRPFPRGALSAQWIGFYKVQKDRTYRWGLESRFGSMLWIDGRIVVDHSGVSPEMKLYSGQIDLKPGLSELRVEYFEPGGLGSLRLLLEHEDGSWKTVCPCDLVPAPVSVLPKQGSDNVAISPQRVPEDLVATGLVARYYSNSDWTGNVLWEGVEGPPSFSRTGSTASRGVGSEFSISRIRDPFSAEWQGLLKVHRTGKYEIGLESDDGSFLFLSGKLVIHNGGSHGRTRKTTLLQLKKGYYPLRLKYFDIGGDASLELLIKPSDFPGLKFSGTQFCHLRDDRKPYQTLPN